jgi:nucleotide-binding universal stress UspA family protein
MKILLAVDGSDFTKKMLAYLATHEELLSLNQDITVVTIHPPVPPRVKKAVGKETLDGYYQEDADKILKPIKQFLTNHALEAKFVTKVGPVGETIAKFATAGKFDLLVMGSHGHGNIVNMVMGSVVNQVLSTCSVPVLIVR